MEVAFFRDGDVFLVALSTTKAAWTRRASAIGITLEKVLEKGFFGVDDVPLSTDEPRIYRSNWIWNPAFSRISLRISV